MSAPHGTKEYYLATATIIPVLLIAYLFSMKSLEALKQLVQNGTSIYMVIIGSIAPTVAIVAALAGELASLLALFSGAPTGTNALWSVVGVVVFPVVGVVHLIILNACESPKLSRGENAGK